MNKHLIVIAGVGSSLLSSSAFAQLWNPLMMVPRPNVIIAHDTSVTMGIDDNCNNCHIPGADRLATSKRDILATLPVFNSYFTYGGFRYSGCDFAKIEPPLILPTPANPSVSEAMVRGAIAGASACGSSERRYPGGNQGNCAKPNCNDSQVVWSLAYGGLPGFDPIGPFKHIGCAYAYNGDMNYCVYRDGSGRPAELDNITSTGCLSSTATVVEYWGCSPSIGFRGECYHVTPWCRDGSGEYDWTWIMNDIANIDWPRWEPTAMDPALVERDLCSKIRPILQRLADDLCACRPDRACYDRLLGGSGWCDPNIIAANACQPGSPLFSTCVCNNSNPRCVNGGRRISNCGNALDWKARQQVAVCQAQDESPGAFVDFFRSQTDNTLSGGCRENAVLFFTDGYMGGTAGVATEASETHRKRVYDSAGGYQNMSVFRVANVFTGDADAMMNSVSAGLVGSSYRATDLNTMQTAFSRLLNRTYQGAYTGSSLSQDLYGTRAAYHIFNVPGYRPVANENAAFVDSYLGWAARIAVHSIDVNGNVSAAPIFETDKAGLNVPGCRADIGNTVLATSLTKGGTFRNGRPRRLPLSGAAMDRNGDGSLDATPAPIELGGMFSTAATKVLIVDAPRDSAFNGANVGTYLAHLTSTRNRPRMYFSWGNGVLHGFYGGRPSGRATIDPSQKAAFTYDDSVPEAGAEVVRYAPNWVTLGAPANSYDYAMNDLVQQPMTTGQLAYTDAYLSTGWKSVLVAAQGPHGSGMASLDVTDPCNAQVLAEWNLPGTDRTSGEPNIYLFPAAAVPTKRAAVVMTGGMGGSATMYAYDVETGAALSPAIALPPGEYPSGAVCLDLYGRGTITNCYAVARDGTLARVDIVGTRFVSAIDVTPAGIKGGGKIFDTRPAVYFLNNGEAGIVYGSGDAQKLTDPSPPNFVFKVVDNVHRKAAGGTTSIAASCAGADPRGIIALPGGHRLVSPPIVRAGVVAWTSFEPDATMPGCNPGRSNIYAMSFDTCADALGMGPRPTPIPGADGVPTSPEIHASSGTLLANSSSGPTGAQTVASTVKVRGPNGKWAKRMYMRNADDIR